MSKVYQIVTDKIVELLDKGEVAWQKPWKGDAIRPFNAATGYEYNGGNFFFLSMFGYAMPAFLTLNQIKKAGARIKAGEEKKHFPVFYAKWMDAKDSNGKDYQYPIFRFTLVWNVEQVEGYKLPKRCQRVTAHDPIEAAESIVKGYKDGPKIDVKQSAHACYSPLFDTVTMPQLGQFSKPESYYSTFFHELGHSTGHAKRLNRKEVTDPTHFGSHDYSVEEMVAELTAAFLSSVAGIDNTIENSAAYIAGWKSKLKDDTKLFWTAAQRAQKAADLILGREKQIVKDDE